MKRCEFTPDQVNSLQPDEVFVFGSNLQGNHAGGAAAMSVSKFGAVYGQGTGLQGQSYAIPTMHGGVETIAPYVDEFISFEIIILKCSFMLPGLDAVLQVSGMNK